MEFTTLKAIEPNKALQKPERKRNPDTNQAARLKTIAFTTNTNKPKVKIIKGKLKTANTGLKIALRIPKTAADTAAFPKLSISTPIGSREIIKKLTVVTNQVIIIPIISSSPYI